MEEKRLYPKQKQDMFGRVEAGAKYGYVDNKENWVIEPIFDHADDFNYNNTDKRNPLNAPVTYNGKYGRIRPDGSYLLKPIYDIIYGFKEGIATVCIKDYKDREKDFYIANWGYVKPDGTYLFEPQFEVAMEFEDGFALVQDENERWGKIDTNGNWVIKPVSRDIDDVLNNH